MSTTELAKHIYFYAQNCKSDKISNQEWNEQDDRQVINYIANLMELHFEPSNHLGSKGFSSISKLDINDRLDFGC